MSSAGFGGILLFVSLFLPWYEENVATAQDNLAEPRLAVELGVYEWTAWEAFSVIDVVLAALAFSLVVVPKPVATALCGVGIALIAFRLVAPPLDDVGLRFGAWVGLAGALVATALVLRPRAAR